MKKIVSFFGDKSEIFYQLNDRAKEYAKSLNMEYRWVPQLPFSEENVIKELQNADAGIIDIEPYGESIFSQIKDSGKLLVRFGVGYDKVDLKSASKNGIAVACGDGRALVITELQADGGRRMAAADYLRGHPVNV